MDVQMKLPTIVICLQNSMKSILMKISVDFECLADLSEHIWEVKKYTLGPKNGNYIKERSWRLLNFPFFEALSKKKDIYDVPIHSYEYPLNYGESP